MVSRPSGNSDDDKVDAIQSGGYMQAAATCSSGLGVPGEETP